MLPARGWHSDFGWWHDPEPLPGVKLFALLAETRPRCGGTLVIAGSHRLVARYVASVPPEERGGSHMHRFMRQQDWFRALCRPGDTDPGRAARFIDHDHHIDGITVRVVELTGQPGDVLLTHPCVLHIGARNTGSYPRMMMTKNLYRRGLGPADG